LKNEYDNALADYSEAIRLDDQLSTAFNNLAWLRATCIKSELRDGKKAVDFATKACELTNWKDCQFLDTLAAAYAENGQFEEAVKWQQKALDHPDFKKEKQEEGLRRRELYASGKPFREE